MQHRVFLSSTFTDLAEHRKAVQVALDQLGVVDVSMEHFGARDERPANECVRLVQQESELFVGIYAHRYGYVPEGNEISISEMEYKAASEAALPRFIYLVDENYPWLPAYIDLNPWLRREILVVSLLKSSTWPPSPVHPAGERKHDRLSYQATAL